MKQKILTFSAVLCIPYVCLALVMEGLDLGAPEVKGQLRCEIRLGTNSVASGAHVPVFVTLLNTGTLEIQLPSLYTIARPGNLIGYSGVKGVYLRMFLLAEQAKGTVQRLALPRAVFLGKPTPEEKNTLEEKPAKLWRFFLKPRPNQWLAIPPHGKEEFQSYVEVNPQTEDGQNIDLLPGTYGLQCEIQYSGRGVNTESLETNQWTSAARIARARAAGDFLLDMHRLWTGKLESNIASFTLTTNSSSQTIGQKDQPHILDR